MATHRLSRRDFVRLGAAGAAATPFVLSPGLVAAAPTAQDIVDRIRKNLGTEWNASTVDTFKAGDPSAAVTGIVTTSLATIDVMRRAVAVGANMVITSGPTFYSRSDSPTPAAGRGRGAAPGSAAGAAPPPPPSDSVFAAKSQFIAANNLVVWRFSDHWRRRTPDPFAQGIADALGWTRYVRNGDPRRVTVPAVTLDELAANVKAGLASRGGIRVVGNPQARVQTIALSSGTIAIQDTLATLPHVDVLIAGEIREWESSEYARDLLTAGRNKALILLGRSLSEDAGMKVCAAWLATLAPEVPVRWLAAGDPYWRPAA
jgi:putative NIF3 family GTP cyclohydrolase 1 type 2